MDCRQVRLQISEGREYHRAVRRHLRRCDQCLGFQQHLQHTEALIQSALPFTAPEALTRRLLDMVPRAAQRLQAETAGRASADTEKRRLWTRQVLYVFLALLPALSIFFWFQVLPALQPLIRRIGALLPLLPPALSYWSGQLGSLLSPVFEALQLCALFLIMALLFEYALRTLKGRSITLQSRR